jgi:hypothetical protein
LRVLIFVYFRVISPALYFFITSPRNSSLLPPHSLLTPAQFALCTSLALWFVLQPLGICDALLRGRDTWRALWIAGRLTMRTGCDLYNRCAIDAQSMRNRCAIDAQSMRNRRAITTQSMRNRFVGNQKRVGIWRLSTVSCASSVHGAPLQSFICCGSSEDDGGDVAGLERAGAG